MYEIGIMVYFTFECFCNSLLHFVKERAKINADVSLGSGSPWTNLLSFGNKWLYCQIWQTFFMIGWEIVLFSKVACRHRRPKWHNTGSLSVA